MSDEMKGASVDVRGLLHFLACICIIKDTLLFCFNAFGSL